MKTALRIALIGCSLLVAGCVTEKRSLWDLETVTDRSRLKLDYVRTISVYERVRAVQSQTSEGWVESGTWRISKDGVDTEIWVYLATLFDKAWMKEDVTDMRSLASSVSGDSYIDFGRSGEYSSDSGAIEYAYYRASGQPCVLVRKYWSDPRTSSDASRAISLQWLAGTSFIYAYLCRSSGADMTTEDLRALTVGIRARDVYWPDDMFIPAAGQF